LKKFFRKNVLSIVLGTAGLATGFLYWKFIGCESGACPIKSNMSMMTLYGGLVGGLLGNVLKGFSKKKETASQ
jgi:hypothetical protein